MNILAIDTSTALLSVGVKRGSAAVREKTLHGFSSHAENLLPLIDEILKEAGIKIADINLFLINRGPGSFTGLRIGFATLKAFLTLKKKPCYGAFSLDMIAEGIPAAGSSGLCVALDASRSKIYVRLYKSKNEKWSPLGKAKIIPVKSFFEYLPQEVTLAGDALGRYRDLVDETIPEKRSSILPVYYWYPRASTLIHYFCRNKIKHGSPRFIQKLEKPGDLLPVYLRLSEAEERKKQYAKSH